MKRYLIQQKDSADTEVESNADQPTTSKHPRLSSEGTQLGSSYCDREDEDVQEESKAPIL